VVVVRDVATGKEPLRWKLPLPAVGFAVTPDSKGIAVSQGDGIVLLDAATGKETRRLQAGRGSAGRIAFSADGKSVVTAAGLVATLIDVETGKPPRRRSYGD
jgi:tricorn protease-like protein